MISVTKLSCARGDRVLFRDLSFSLSPGELMHLKGKNGSGKTTLLRSLCGLFLPQDGEIRWNGQNIRSLGEDYRRQVVYLGHLNGIKDDLTAVENLRVSSVLDDDRVNDEQIWAALKSIGLRGFEDLPTRVLSQGQKRRVALARLLLTDSPLWILDEPFTALDAAAVEQLQSIIADHVASDGTVIVTTHQEVALTSGKVKTLGLGN